MTLLGLLRVTFVSPASLLARDIATEVSMVKEEGAVCCTMVEKKNGYSSVSSAGDPPDFSREPIRIFSLHLDRRERRKKEKEKKKIATPGFDPGSSTR